MDDDHQARCDADDGTPEGSTVCPQVAAAIVAANTGVPNPARIRLLAEREAGAS